MVLVIQCLLNVLQVSDYVLKNFLGPSITFKPFNFCQKKKKKEKILYLPQIIGCHEPLPPTKQGLSWDRLKLYFFCYV